MQPFVRAILRSILVRNFAVCLAFSLFAFSQGEDLAFLQRRAEAGNAEAQFKLAEAYYGSDAIKITGLKPDFQQGLEWLQKAALHGYAPAEYALGVVHADGLRVPKDPHEAAHWFQKAARQKNKMAQDRLAQMLAQGLISRPEANWQPLAKSKTKSFSLSEIETGLSGGITSKRMAMLVDTYGVDFKLNSELKKRLGDEGADDSLLAAISASKH